MPGLLLFARHPIVFERRSSGREALTLTAKANRLSLNSFPLLIHGDFSGMADTLNIDVAPSKGGVGVVAFVFFVLACLITIAAQMAWSARAGSAVVESSEERVTRELAIPKPELAPEQVVEVQLEGLGSDDLTWGIKQCFEFASPGNKQSTGPLTRFAAMVQKAPYDALIKRHLVLVGTPHIDDEKAIVMVTILDDHDEIRVFEFWLSKQHGEGVEDCWMTDAVYPLRQLSSPPAGESSTAAISPTEASPPTEGGHA